MAEGSLKSHPQRLRRVKPRPRVPSAAQCGRVIQSFISPVGLLLASWSVPTSAPSLIHANPPAYPCLRAEDESLRKIVLHPLPYRRSRQITSAIRRKCPRPRFGRPRSCRQQRRRMENGPLQRSNRSQGGCFAGCASPADSTPRRASARLRSNCLLQAEYRCSESPHINIVELPKPGPHMHAGSWNEQKDTTEARR
jgi:hypothetical protein